MTRTRRFHVLIATDGSPAARAAVTSATRMPWPPEARASIVVARSVSADVRRSILWTALDRTSDAVARTARRAILARWPDASAAVIEGEPVRAIVGQARARRADVIALGWRGHGALRRLLTGSVSRGVVRQAPCAVLVVRRPLRALRHVVVGCDGSRNAWRAVRWLARLAPAPGTRITLLRAVETMPVPAQGLVPADLRATVAAEVARINEARRAAAGKDVARAADLLSASGWNVDAVVTDDAPLHALLSKTTSVGADLLVVGATGTSALRQLLLGSVAEGALNQSRVPVLVVR